MTLIRLLEDRYQGHIDALVDSGVWTVDSITGYMSKPRWRHARYLLGSQVMVGLQQSGGGPIR
jgi:hypothetical protein